MFRFAVKKISDDAILPSKVKVNDPGLDIYTNEQYVIKPGETHAFTTGISVQIPVGYVALIWDRSSLGLKGLHRFAGVIDADYRGEWKIVIHNASQEPYEILKGDRIAQCIFQRVEPVIVEEVKELETTARATGGFGSTGR